MLKIFIVLSAFCCLLIAAQREKKYPDYLNHHCKRTCKVSESPRVCEYDFNIQYYFTMMPDCLNCIRNGEDCSTYNECMVADQHRRLVKVFNGMLPGPSIEVCVGDTIKVNIKNDLDSESTSIHWHGQHQRDTPWMDGVPMVTQCGIPSHTTFQYKFTATEVGTHFYHSHTSTQRTDGAYGHLIVRQPDLQNVHKKLYDLDLSEHVISIADWFDQPADYHIYNYERNKIFYRGSANAILVNGIGNNRTNTVPPKIFRVRQNYRYRFRLIHAGAVVCPITLRIEGHRMLVINSDGSDINPQPVDSITLTNGERFDFVLQANKTRDTYRMRFVGDIYCDYLDTISILQYEDAPLKRLGFTPFNERYTNGMELNCVNFTRGNLCINYDRIQGLRTMPRNIQDPTITPYYIVMDVIHRLTPRFAGVMDSEIYTPVINNITFAAPNYPLAFEPNQSPASHCNVESPQNCVRSFCQCTHTVEIPFGVPVEMVLVDEGVEVDLIHPMHLHGYQFYVVAQGKLGVSTSAEAVRSLDRRGGIRRNLYNPPLKDAVSVPDGGYTIIRFIADNPGFWLLHCHIDYHTEEGMQMVLKVGDCMKTMPRDFPQFCGDYPRKVPARNLYEYTCRRNTYW